MKLLLEKIDKYLVIKEKSDVISLSLKSDGDIKDIIEIVRKSDNMEKTLSMFNDSIKEQIKKLIDGGILKNGFK